MTYDKPLPQPTPETQPYWDSLRSHAMQLPLCSACNEFFFYPRPFCPKCYSRDVGWAPVSGHGRLETYVVNHRPAPGFEEDAPYVIAIITLDEGPRLMSNLIGVDPRDPSSIPVDLPVEIVYDDVTDVITLPKFQPSQPK